MPALTSPASTPPAGMREGTTWPPVLLALLVTAIHLASATVVGVQDFASFDRAFRPVAGLSLWNNRLHRGSPPGAPATE